MDLQEMAQVATIVSMLVGILIALHTFGWL